MLEIIYESKASEGVGAADLFNIIQKSADNNAQAGLTGFLIFSHDRFFQVIEGPKERIVDLMQRLEQDPRHQSIRVVDQRTITQTSFPQWRMKRLMPAETLKQMDEQCPELRNAPAHIRKAAMSFLQRTTSG